MCELIIDRMFSMYLQNSTLHYFSSNGRKSRAYLKVLHDKTKNVIIARRLEMSNENFAGLSNDDDDCSIGKKQKFAFLDSLLYAQNEGAPLTDKQIEDEVNTFMFEVKINYHNRWIFT